MPFDFPNGPATGDTYSGYVWDGIAWNLTGIVAAATIGDTKSGMQVADHSGWILLDGRAISTLTASQQTNAITLGFATNLPNGQLCSLRQDSAAAPGVVGGSSKITLAQLPVHNLSLTALNTSSYDPAAATTSGSDPGAVTTSGVSGGSGTSSSAGDHNHNVTVYRSNGAGVESMFGRATDDDQSYTGVVNNAGAHTHTFNTPAHTHTVDMPNHTHTVDFPGHTHTVGGTLPLGGSAADYYNKAIVVNFFVYLGT